MLKTLLHRAAAVAAGALLGLTALSAVSSPATAAPSAGDAASAIDITGDRNCVTETGEWVVTWTVTNTWGAEAKVEQLRTAPAPVPGLENGLYLPRRAPSGTNGKQIFIQKLTGSPATASVSFIANFGNNKDKNNSATVTLGACEPAETPCTAGAFHHTFTVGEGRATASVKLDDGVRLCQDEPVTLVTYFAPKPEFSVPQYAFTHETATLTNENREIRLSAALPDCNAQVDLFFGAEDDIIAEITENGPRYGDLKLGSGGGLGGRSKGPQGWYNGGSKGCHQPSVETVSQCDGTVNVNLSNNGDLTRYAVDFTITAGTFSKTVTVAPKQGETVQVPAGSGRITVTADGMKDVVYDWTRPEECAPPTVTVKNDCKSVTVTVTNPADVVPASATVAYGSESKQVTVAPGTSEQVTFTPGEATTVTVTFADLNLEPITATIEHPDCSETPGDGSGDGDGDNGGEAGGEGGLPVTGAAAGGIAAGAVALLAAGGVLFFLARRRRVTFTP